VKIAIVNDMALGVEALRRVVVTVPGYEVIWIARDGAEAVEKCKAQRPDVILMDLLMPVMDGVEATRRIMSTTPCAILVVTATVTGNISKVFDAMGFGALDAVCTPVLGSAGDMSGAQPLLSKIKNVAALMTKGTTKQLPVRSSKSALRPKTQPLIVIGASTGGPQALAQIMSRLPADFKTPIVIVQHVDQLFAPGLAEWLSLNSKIGVRVIAPGGRAEPGCAWLACSNDHLVLNADLTFSYTVEPRDYAYRPSVDVFFDSVAQHWPGAYTAVLLTGMGRDGARGMLVLRQHKWHTIAQDEKSCIVYGMPKAAVAIDAACEVLPLSKIAGRLQDLNTPLR
jgi:two-component system, chemotaxis family, response regulator WspF